MNKIKHILLPLLFALTAILTGSCGEKLPSPEASLSYQTYPLCLNAVYNCAGFEAKVEIIMTDAFTGTVSYTAPQTLAGIRARVEGDTTTYSCGGITLPPLTLPDGDASLIAAMLSLDPSKMISVAAVNSGAACTAVFASEKGEVTVCFDAKTGGVLSLTCADFSLKIKG